MSFDSCYAFWWNKAQNDDNIDMAKLFGETRNFKNTIVHNTGKAKHPIINNK